MAPGDAPNLFGGDFEQRADLGSGQALVD